MRVFLKALAAGGGSTVRVGKSVLPGPIDADAVDAVVERFSERNLVTTEQLAERALRGIDFATEAGVLGVTPLQAAVIYQAALDGLSAPKLEGLKRAVAHPRSLGALPASDPLVVKVRQNTPVVTNEELAAWATDEYVRIFLPRGPIAAVDMRPWFTPARDQGGRGTCTSFASTAVREALEYARDRRPGPRHLSEEMHFWYAKWGQLYAAGGYDGVQGLIDYTDFGGCEALYYPYDTTQISVNQADSPVPDDALDRAGLYTADAVVGLPNNGDQGDIDAVKTALASGRCVVIAIDPDNGWDTGAGMVSFPSPLDSAGRGSSHCTAIIGYIDYDDLPEVCEGGYFIVRNSWDQAGSTSNVLGQEYGGHLLMPYGWYRRYVSESGAFVADQPGSTWIAEYFANPSLAGLPAVIEEIDAVNFDWGAESPVEIAIPDPFGPPLEIDEIPAVNWSARFSRIQRFRPGWWSFSLSGDDGVRLWVDDRLVINAWHDQSSTDYVAEHYLSGGDHVLRIEYYQHLGVASVAFSYAPVNWQYELFANDDLSGVSAATFTDTTTNLEWRQAPPVSGAFTDGVFSLRATGTKHFTAGQYAFHTQNTGGCRISLDGTVVLDDWTSGSPDGAPVDVTDGSHQLTVEFRNDATIPALGSGAFYRAALAFDWSEANWQVSLYRDPARQAIANASWPNPDSFYEGLRTDALTGFPIFEYGLPGQYWPPVTIAFSPLAQLVAGIPGAPDLSDTDWLSAHIRRRVFVPTAGTYEIDFTADDGHRLIVDGKQLAEAVRPADDSYQGDVYLDVGVHDIAIEYANAQYDGYIQLSLNTASWLVTYFSDTELANWAAELSADSVEDFISSGPSSVTGSQFSLSAQRTYSRGVGRYRVQVRADGGVRVKVAGVALIDAWADEGPSSYVAFVDHRGGDMPIEIEYYNDDETPLLEFALVPEGFFAEYYRGTSLQTPAPGSSVDRNVPIAYGFEPALNFAWGTTGPSARVGADQFSARWRGQLILPEGTWQISITSDDGARAFLDGRMIIDAWEDQAATTVSARMNLVGRSYDLVVEYYQDGGDASCRLAILRLT